MLATFFSSIFAIGLFATGYYLGYQMGSTQHVRKQLAEAHIKQQD